MENKKEYTINVSRETLEGVVMIDRKKMTTLLINVISVKMLLTFPKIMIINSGNAAWIECIYNTLIVIGLFWITTKLYRSNKNIIQLAEMTGKKWLKIIVGVVICTPKVRHFWRCIFLWQRKGKNIENTRQNSNYLL